jgi:hypothetical protein
MKIDVDGNELAVLNGAVQTLRSVDVVIIEAAVHHQFLDRLSFLMKHGFALVDIVDLCYYKDTLWQVDLVMVRQPLLNQYPALTPFSRSPFSAKDYIQH